MSTVARDSTGRGAVNLRPATEEDLAQALEIYNDVVRTSTATFEETPRELTEFIIALREKRSAGIPWLVADCGGVIVGYGTYGPFRKASGYRVTVEHSLHIRSDFRGCGVGSLVLRELIAEARSNHVQSMIAALDSSNAASVRLHQRFGFTKVGEIPNVAEKFSRSLNLVLMQLLLKTPG